MAALSFCLRLMTQFNIAAVIALAAWLATGAPAPTPSGSSATDSIHHAGGPRP